MPTAVRMSSRGFDRLRFGGDSPFVLPARSRARGGNCSVFDSDKVWLGTRASETSHLRSNGLTGSATGHRLTKPDVTTLTFALKFVNSMLSERGEYRSRTYLNDREVECFQILRYHASRFAGRPPRRPGIGFPRQDARVRRSTRRAQGAETVSQCYLSKSGRLPNLDCPEFAPSRATHIQQSSHPGVRAVFAGRCLCTSYRHFFFPFFAGVAIK